MLTIYKYPIEAKTVIEEVNMKARARILTFQAQNDKLCIWALVDPDEADEVRSFRLVGTGEPVKHSELKNAEYIGTTQVFDGAVVAHLFELKCPPVS